MRRFALSLFSSLALYLTHSPTPTPSLSHFTSADDVVSSSRTKIFTLASHQRCCCWLSRTNRKWLSFFVFFFFLLEDISHECLCQFALRARRLVQCCVGRTFFQVLHFGNQMMGNPRDTVLCIHLESKVPRKASGRVFWGFDLRSSKDLNGLKCTFVYVEDCCSRIGTTGRLRKGHSWWRWKNLILRGVALWMTSVAAELFSLYGRGVAEQIYGLFLLLSCVRLLGVILVLPRRATAWWWRWRRWWDHWRIFARLTRHDIKIIPIHKSLAILLYAFLVQSFCFVWVWYTEETPFRPVDVLRHLTSVVVEWTVPWSRCRRPQEAVRAGYLTRRHCTSIYSIKLFHR